MNTTLILIRHGHTIWNELGRYQGHAPTSLSDRGKAQVVYLAQSFAGEEAPVALYSSDLARCQQTAEPVARVLGLPVHDDPRLREMDYGNWQGLTRSELMALDVQAFEARQADPFNVPVPGGESQAMLAVRVVAALDEMLARHAGEHVVVVTHGGPIREALRHFGLWNGGLPVSNASRSVLEVSGDGQAALLLYNDVAHLPLLLRPSMSGTTFLVPR